MEDPKRLLVVIPVYSHWDYAFATVESLLATTPNVSALIVDDASPETFSRPDTLALRDKIFRLLVESRPQLDYRRFDNNDGLTRSWNLGLNYAKDKGFEYACCANSDLLFTKNWHEPLIYWLRHGRDLVGPVSNAPGHTSIHQFVGDYAPGYKLTDEPAYLDEVAAYCYKENLLKVCDAQVNGFCMLAKTQTWWDGRFDADHVFDPSKKMAGNEVELQARWVAADKVIAVVPGSFVFHYRSVTRGPRYCKGKWMRRLNAD